VCCVCVSCIYEWSLVLACESSLKRAVDFVLCSLCYVQSDCVLLLLEWMGVVSADGDDSTVADTDDLKGCHRNQPLTDDVKADGASVRLRRNVLAAQPLHTAQLATLAVSCQSLLALRKLIDSGIVSALCSSLYVTCQQKLNDALSAALLVSESEPATSDAARSTGVSSHTDDASVSDVHSGKCSFVSYCYFDMLILCHTLHHKAIENEEKEKELGERYVDSRFQIQLWRKMKVAAWDRAGWREVVQCFMFNVSVFHWLRQGISHVMSVLCVDFAAVIYNLLHALTRSGGRNGIWLVKKLSTAGYCSNPKRFP